MTSFSFSLNSISHFAAMALFLRALIPGRGTDWNDGAGIAFRPASAAIVIRKKPGAKECVPRSDSAGCLAKAALQLADRRNEAAW
jgi:hypothetical protein